MKTPSLLHRGWNWTRNQDLAVLVMAFIVVAGAWLFIELADEVREGSTEKFDKAILKMFRNANDPSQPIGRRSIQEGFRDFTALGGTPVLCLVSGLVGGFLLLTRKYWALLLLAAALGGGQLLSKLLKLYFSRPRPEYVNPLHYVDSYSFPSGHALVSAVVYLTLGAILARFVATRWLKVYVVATACLLTFLVGFTRVYLGVHYPTDVLGGWTIGLLWAIICWLVARALQRRGAIEQAGIPQKPQL